MLKFKLSLAIARKRLTEFGLLYTNFKLKYENSENIKADQVNTVVFKLRQIKRRAFLCFFFLGGGAGHTVE